jgi:hypothetical protein
MERNAKAAAFRPTHCATRRSRNPAPHSSRAHRACALAPSPLAASVLADRSRLRGRGGSTSLLGQGREVLLTTLERSDFLAGRVLKIHCKEERPDHQAGHAGCNILADLQALLGGKPGDLLVVRLDLGRNGRAIRVSILGLNDRNRLRSPAGARRHRQLNTHHQTNSAYTTHASLGGFRVEPRATVGPRVGLGGCVTGPKSHSKNPLD